MLHLRTTPATLFLSLLLSLAAAQSVPEGFQDEVTTVNGVNYHYVIGGEGPAIVLLHGWPTTWYLWHEVMPGLAEAGYTVIAPDSRGQGDTALAEGGYDPQTVADDIRALVGSLGIDSHYIAAHDLGTWVAYAYANEYPDAVERLVVLDVLFGDASFDPPNAPSLEQNFWHFAFHDAEGIPEMLLSDKIPEYLGYFYTNFSFDPAAISREDAQVFVDAYSKPGYLESGLAYYRSIEETVELFEAYKADGLLQMPVLAIGAQVGVGQYFVDQMAAVSADFEGRVLENSGHWMPLERPDAITEAIITFFQ